MAQKATITHTVGVARDKQIGKTVHTAVNVPATGAGTPGPPYRPPCTLRRSKGRCFLRPGRGRSSTRPFHDDGLVARANDTTTEKFFHDTSGNNAFGGVPAVTIAAGDVITMQFTYEAA